MTDITRILKMSSDELDQYLQEQSKLIIDQANNPVMEARLIGLQWKCNMLRQKYKDNQIKLMIELQTVMMKSFRDLHEELNRRI